MKTSEIWTEQIPKPTDPNSTITNQVWGVAYNNDGAITVGVVGNAILVYDSNTGEMVNKHIRGAHKETINALAFSKDGKRFATGSSDKFVIIWNYNSSANPSVNAEMKYSQNESVYCLSFNPLTSQIFSAGSTDYALWTPDVTQIDKQKYKEKIICCSWSADGQTLAFGTMNGTIVFRTRKLEEKLELKKGVPIWCMDWTPVTPENQESILAVGAWDQTITFYNQQGQQLGSDKKFLFDPLSIHFFSTGEYYILSGTNKKASLYSKDGGFLIDVCEKQDWIWSAKLKPKEMQAVVSTNNGEITQYKITPLTVHSLFKDKYAFRDSLTDVVIQNIIINQKIRLKCKELVRNISLHKEKLAANLHDKILIYTSTTEDNQMKYRLHKKISKSIDCQFMQILSNNLLIAVKRKLQLLKFSGEVEREWVLDASIQCLKFVGGPPKRENVLVGLSNGSVLKIFVDNSFPVVIYSNAVSIVCADLSLDKKRLAIVDINKNLTVIDLVTKDVVQQEMNILSAVFNQDFNELLAYSGNDMIFIKSGNQQPLSQKMNGNVIGFIGSKIFVLNNNILNTIDVSLTSIMTKYIEKKEYGKAFDITNLGSTSNDFKLLGIEALNAQEYNIAKKCFMRIKDHNFLELAKKYENLKSNNSVNEVFLQGESLAYQGKFDEADKIYKQGGFPDKAVELWSDLKKFDKIKFGKNRPQTGSGPIAPASIDSQGPVNTEQMRKILKDEAEWRLKNGEWKQSAELFLQAQEYKKAIDIYGNNNYMEGLIEVCRQIDKNDNATNLQLCAYYFRKNKHHQFAKEAYLKMNDLKSLMALHIELEKWEDALLLGKQNAELLEMVKLPYANYLCKSDRYEEALRAFKQLGRHDLTTKMLYTLSENAARENRFEDAAYFYFVLATENLSLIKNYKKPVGDDIEYFMKFKEFNDIAEVYFAYSKIYSFIEEPFQPMSGMSFLLSIFNAARFAISKLGNKSLYGVKQSYLYYALGKVSKNLEAFKTARLCYEKLGVLPEWSEEVELCNLLIRSKPFSDKEALLPICNRCMNTNPVLTNGNQCQSCMHQFIHSMMSFDNLPLVEFKVDPKLNHRKVIELLYSDKSKIQKKKPKKKDMDDGWTESTMGNEQVLSFQQSQGQGGGDEETTVFLEKLNEVFEMQQTSQEYIPVTLEEEIIKTLDPDEVYWIDYSKYCPSAEIKYFKCMVSDISLKTCDNCGKFFQLDEYEFEYLKSKKCPFCKCLDKREGPQKDIFEI